MHPEAAERKAGTVCQAGGKSHIAYLARGLTQRRGGGQGPSQYEVGWGTERAGEHVSEQGVEVRSIHPHPLLAPANKK
jgi:hypothetical protein